MEGGNSSVTLLWEPVGLQRQSNTLELTGRVELSVQESSMQTSFHLDLTDSADGEGECPCLQELRALRDFSWLSEVGSLKQEGFLAEVESGHFGVEVLELRPELWWGPPLLLEHLVLRDSTDRLGIITLGGGCFITSGSLACWYEGAGGTGISSSMWGDESPTT